MKIAIAFLLSACGVTLICVGTIDNDIGMYTLGAACLIMLMMLVRP